MHVYLRKQRVAGFERHLQTPDHLWCDECTCSCGYRVFLAQEVKKGTTPPLFLTFKIPSNSPPLVQEEGDVTQKWNVWLVITAQGWAVPGESTGVVLLPLPIPSWLPHHPHYHLTSHAALSSTRLPTHPATNPPFLSLTLCVNLQLPTQSFIMASQHTGHPWSSSSQPHRARKEDSTADKHIAHQITNVYNDKHKPQRPAHAHIAAEH